MKHLLLSFVFVSTFLSARSQDDGGLSAVLQKIISDSSAFFATYKGQVKQGLAYDSLYHSTLTVPGTFNNEISFSASSASYFASIGEMISEKEGYAQLKKWKQLLKNVLGNDYTMKEQRIEYRAGEPTKQYRFTRGNLAVTIFCNNLRHVSKKDKACFVHLQIHYYQQPE